MPTQAAGGHKPKPASAAQAPAASNPLANTHAGVTASNVVSQAFSQSMGSAAVIAQATAAIAPGEQQQQQANRSSKSDAAPQSAAPATRAAVSQAVSTDGQRHASASAASSSPAAAEDGTADSQAGAPALDSTQPAPPSHAGSQQPDADAAAPAPESKDPSAQATQAETQSGADTTPAPRTGAEAANGIRAHIPWIDSTTPSAGPDALPAATGSNGATRPAADPQPTTPTNATPAPAPAQAHASSTAQAGSAALPGQPRVAGTQVITAGTSQQTTTSVAGTATQTAPITSAGSGPAAAPSTAAPPFTYGTRVQETIEAIHATVALASRQGAAQAQISLEPAELGAVRIHLTQTGEGLIARVSAQTAAGAQAIASGQSELHSTLSSLGVSLLRLDVSSFAQQQAQTGEQAPRRPGQPARGEHTELEAEELASAGPTSTVSLSSASALIDVLA